MTTTTYLLRGFHREDHDIKGLMLVDFDEDGSHEDTPHDIGQLAAPQFCFNSSETIGDVVVPDDLKLRLFTGDEVDELRDRVPSLEWYLPKRKRRQKAGRRTNR